MSNNNESKKKFTIFEEEKEDKEENLAINHNDNKKLHYKNIDIEENISILIGISKVLMIISVIGCTILFFRLASDNSANGITFLTYIIIAGIIIFGSYISSTLIKTHALKLHQLHEINKTLEKLITEKKK